MSESLTLCLPVTEHIIEHHFPAQPGGNVDERTENRDVQMRQDASSASFSRCLPGLLCGVLHQGAMMPVNGAHHQSFARTDC